MIEVLAISGAIAVFVFAVVAVLGLSLIRRFARDEVKDKVRRVVIMLLIAAVTGAAIWAPYATRRHGFNADAELAYLCKGAGEKIYRTARNVDGVFVRPPPRGHGSLAYHENDARPDAYLRRPRRSFHFVEIGSFAPGMAVRRTAHADPDPVTTELAVPTARYGLTWRGLLDWRHWNAGVFGEETIIYDLKTREMLARRVIYYRERRADRAGDEESFVVCDKVDPGVDDAYRDRRPRDSYNFVVRVLEPPQLTLQERIAGHDLAVGAGARKTSCMTVTIEEGIRREDLELWREDTDLVISRRNSDDAIRCDLFYFFGPVTMEQEAGTDAVIRFADGTVVLRKELGDLPSRPKSGRSYKPRWPRANDSPATDPAKVVPTRDYEREVFEAQEQAAPRRGSTETAFPRGPEMPRHLPGAQEPSAESSRMERWVDDEGVVHYTDPHLAPKRP